MVPQNVIRFYSLQVIFHLFPLLKISKSQATLEIEIFTDLEEARDKAFFKSDFRQLIYNFGHLVDLKFYFIDRGPLVPTRMCVLDQISTNPYLQAYYLECEANGKSIYMCRKFFNINSHRLKHCILNIKSVEREVDKRIVKARIGVNDLPTAIFAHSTIVKMLTYERFHHAICQQFTPRPVACKTKRVNISNSLDIVDIPKHDSNITSAEERHLKAVAEILDLFEYGDHEASINYSGSKEKARTTTDSKPNVYQESVVENHLRAKPNRNTVKEDDRLLQILKEKQDSTEDSDDGFSLESYKAEKKSNEALRSILVGI